MPRFAANLTMMYNEHAFLDRFAAAAKDGFKAVEFLFPYDFPAADIKARLDEHGLTQALFNAPPGDWAAGERGIASLPGREDEFARCARYSAGIYRRARQQDLACDGRSHHAGTVAREASRGVSEEPGTARRAPRAQPGSRSLSNRSIRATFPAFFSTARTTRRRSARKSARRISRCSSIAITARSWKATSRSNSNAT